MSEEPTPKPSLAERIAAANAREEAAEAARPRKHPRHEGWDGDPASGWLEYDAFEIEEGVEEVREDQDRRLPTYTRQVCIRLSHAHYDDLEHAADIYGVAPGTMGRMLVRRGARAVLYAHRSYDLEQGIGD